MKEYAKDIANCLIEYLTSQKWNFTYDEDNGIIRFRIKLQGPLRFIDYIVDVEESDYLVFGSTGVGGDVDDPIMMSALAEYICCCNLRLKNGGFVFDLQDGEILYKTYVDCEGITPSAEVIANSIHCPVHMFEKYGPGLTSIIFCGISTKEAIKQFG